MYSSSYPKIKLDQFHIFQVNFLPQILFLPHIMSKNIKCPIGCMTIRLKLFSIPSKKYFNFEIYPLTVHNTGPHFTTVQSRPVQFLPYLVLAKTISLYQIRVQHQKKKKIAKKISKLQSEPNQKSYFGLIHFLCWRLLIDMLAILAKNTKQWLYLMWL